MNDDEGSAYYKDGWTAGYLAGREDAAADIEAVPVSGMERSLLAVAADIARAVPVSEGVRAVYRNLNGPTHEEPA